MKVVPAKMLENRDEGQHNITHLSQHKRPRVSAKKGRAGAHRIGTDLGDFQKKGTRRENELEGTVV